MSTSVVYQTLGPEGASSCGATGRPAVAVSSLPTNATTVTAPSPS